MHMAVHQLIAGREGRKKKKRKKASLQSSLWSPCVPVWAQVTLFQRDEGWEGLTGEGGVSNVCMMSKKGIKIKEGIIAEISLCFTTGERSK